MTRRLPIRFLRTLPPELLTDEQLTQVAVRARSKADRSAAVKEQARRFAAKMIAAFRGKSE